MVRTQGPQQDSGSVGTKKSLLWRFFGECYKSEFSGRHTWQSTISEKVRRGSCPPYPLLGGPQLPKMLVFFEILTSDDMQDDASDMLQFLGSIKKWSKLGQKTDILTHFKVFCYTHLHPMSYTPRYCQMKDIIKI